MAFIPEDGSGVPNANSYVSVEQADAYFTARGANQWEGTDEQKQMWLTLGTEYVGVAFANRLGCKIPLTTEQGLLFPTKEDGYPEALVRAVCEYAVRAKNGPLMPDPVMDASGFALITTKKKVGPIEKAFAIGGAQTKPQLFRNYPYPDGLMSSLFCAGTGGNRVIR